MSESDSLAALLTWSLACVLVAGVAISLSLARRRLADDAQQALDGAGELRDGGTLVSGIVRIEGHEPAITVRITEVGKQWKHKGTWHHKWTETAREVSVRPFDLETERGTVRIEPSRNVFLVDRLDVTSRLHTQRVRTAALTNGERAAITGRLRRERGAGDGAYRSGPEKWVLGPPSAGAMVVATEPLADRHRTWARFHALVAIVPIALLLAVNGFAYPAFYDFVLHGEPAVGTVLERTTYTTHDRHGTHHHYQLDVDVDGTDSVLRVTQSGYDRAPEGARVAVLRSPSGRVSLGREAGIDAAWIVFPVVASLVALLLVWARRRQRLLWWEQKRVVTMGRGPL